MDTSVRLSRRMLRPLLVLAAAGALAACALGGQGGPASIQVRVDNAQLLDVAVYVVAGSQRQRIGTVTGHQEAELQIPAGVATGPGSSLRLLIDPVGSRESHLTDAVLVSPGDTVILEVRSPLSLTSVSVR